MFRVTEAAVWTLVLTSRSTKLGTSVSSSGWTIAAYVFPRTTRRSYLMHKEVNKFSQHLSTSFKTYAAHYASEYATTIQWPCLHLLTLHDSLLTLALPLTMSSSNFRLRMTSRRLLSHMMFPWPFVSFGSLYLSDEANTAKKRTSKAALSTPTNRKLIVFLGTSLQTAYWNMDNGKWNREVDKVKAFTAV